MPRLCNRVYNGTIQCLMRGDVTVGIDIMEAQRRGLTIEQAKEIGRREAMREAERKKAPVTDRPLAPPPDSADQAFNSADRRFCQ